MKAVGIQLWGVGGRHLSSDWEFIFLPETEVACYFVFSEARLFLLEHVCE